MRLLAQTIEERVVEMPLVANRVKSSWCKTHGERKAPMERVRELAREGARIATRAGGEEMQVSIGGAEANETEAATNPMREPREGPARGAIAKNDALIVETEHDVLGKCGHGSTPASFIATTAAHSRKKCSTAHKISSGPRPAATFAGRIAKLWPVA